MSFNGSPCRYSGAMTTEDYSPNAMASMIASCTSVGVQGAASLTRCKCENKRKSSMNLSSHSGAMDLFDYDIGEEDGSDGRLYFGAKKRRLTFEQVKRLEKSFKVANKLEPERKIQLAKALGLQPRQIAVWFQNRRARCKTKQVEKDYDALKQEYDDLKRKYDAAFHENKQFKAEVKRLNRESGNTDKNSDLRVLDFEIETLQNSANSALKTTDVPMESKICKKCAAPLGDIYPTNTKAQEVGCCSIMSEAASSVFNIDSPRTIESRPSPRFPQIVAATGTAPANSSPARVVEGSSIRPQIAGGLETLETPQESNCLQQTLQEAEEDQISSLNQAEETCRNLFYSLDQQGPFMLWDYWAQ